MAVVKLPVYLVRYI